MAGMTRRGLLLGAGGVVGWLAARRLTGALPTLRGTRALGTAMSEGIVNDASGLSATPVHKHLTLKQDPDNALISAIRAEMASAAQAGRPVNVAAARHSMGGQAIPRDGHALVFDNGFVEPDRANGIYRVHAGARWSQVIAALDPIGWSPKVMQSNHDFGVAATFCVNAHGWPVPHGPMGSTVRSFRMVVPSGDLVTCSRSENTDLFNATMGGYGLTGAIVDMVVEMTPNQRLTPTFERLSAEACAPAFMAATMEPDVTMAYGRLNVGRARFFERGLMITYRPSTDQAALPPAAGSGAVSHIAGRLYRAQLGNETMKRFRWWMEATAAPYITTGSVTRNGLINEPVATLDDRDPDRTDILHEYFVSPDRFDDFLLICREVIPASYQEFLNVTLRFVDRDPDSYLSYAPVPRIAAVMSFSQEMTARAEADMARMTRSLVDGITEIGGSYYLPYRPHPTVDQLARAYPRAAGFAAFKRFLDPELRFRNNFWDMYLSAL